MRQSAKQKAWTVLAELTLYGFLVRIGQLGVILLALQFSQIFTNPAQIIFLFPIAIAILIILGLLTLVEIECSRYVGMLDARLNIINSFTTEDSSSGQQNYLERTILPITLNILALPVVACFLAWTTPYLYLILVISTLISCLIIIKYNIKIRRPSSSLSNALNSYKDANENIETIPLYLLRNFENSTNPFDKKLIACQESLDATTILKTRKRKFLSLTKKSTRVIVLVAAVSLAVLNVTNIAKIAGFLLIGNVFRKGCTSIAEFMSSTNQLFPLDKSLNLLSESMTSTSELKKRLFYLKGQAFEKSLEFNARYESLIKNHPYLRFKNLSIRDIDGTNIAANISSRVLLGPITVITTANNKIASRVKILLENKNKKSLDSLERYIFNGDVVLGRLKLTNSFFREMSVYNSENIFVGSLDILDYFEGRALEEVKQLMKKEIELVNILDSIVNFEQSVESHNSRQINQFRSILQLCFIYTQPECISLLNYGLDYFEPSDIKNLLNIFIPLFKDKLIHLIIMSRYTLPEDSECSCYQFNQSEIQKV